MSEMWGIVNLMGHSRVAGRLSEYTLGGTFLRVDVPAVNGNPEMTFLYGMNAIFGVSIVDKEIAEEVARQIDVSPVNPYGMKDAFSRYCRDRLKGEQDECE